MSMRDLKAENCETCNFVYGEMNGTFTSETRQAETANTFYPYCDVYKNNIYDFMPYTTLSLLIMSEKMGVYIWGLSIYMWMVLSSVLYGMQIIFSNIITIEVSSQSILVKWVEQEHLWWSILI